MQSFSPKSEGSEPYIGLLSPGLLHQEDKPSECSALKASRVYFWETLLGNTDSTLKGHTQNLMCFGTQGRSSNLKGAWVQTSLLILESLLERKEAMGHHIGTDTDCSHLGESFYHEDTCVGKMNLIDVYRTFHPKAAAPTAAFQVHMEHAPG